MSEYDSIEALLRATGRRPAVPPDRTARVRDAARAEWRSQAAASARRRRIRWGTSLAAAAIVVVAVGLEVRSLRSPFTDVVPGIRVERVVNVASARRGAIALLNPAAKLDAGSILLLGSTVTTAADARVALRTPSGHSIRLDTGTTLRLLSDHAFSLEHGAVYVDSHGVGRPIRIETVVGILEDRGTQFEARFDRGSLSLRVREGTVTLEAPTERVVAGAGETLRLDRSGRIDRGEPRAGGAWAWTEAIAPMMEIEGASLIDFLQWGARERGARLVFTDEGLAARAPAIVLSGSIAGMTLEEATTSVLTTCGLSHRWEGGALIVGPGRKRPHQR